MDTITGLTLLEGLRDPQNDAAWQRFAARYRPMVVSFAAGLGLWPPIPVDHSPGLGGSLNQTV